MFFLLKRRISPKYKKQYHIILYKISITFHHIILQSVKKKFKEVRRKKN